jgi:hypothetical protein
MVSFIARVCPVSVLLLGLVSCNQKDVKTLNVPQPTWESGRKSEAFFQTERTVTDQISFAKSPAALLRATTRCEDRDRHHSESSTQFSLPGNVPLYSLVPRELLKPEALNNDVHCSLSFLAFDANGASHTFSLGDLKILNSNAAAGIEPTADIPVYSVLHFRQAGFRFAHAKNAEVHFACTDFSIVTPATDRRDFLLREIAFPPDFDEGRANQKCRLLAVEGGQTALMSPEFPVHFRSDLQIETHIIPGSNLTLQPTPVFSVKMINNSDDRARLRWPKTNADRFFALFYVELPQWSHVPLCPGTTFAKVQTTTKIDFEKKENLKWIETPSFIQFEIPPQTTISGTIIVTPQPMMFPSPVQVRSFQPMELRSYYGENWHPLEKLDWNVMEFPVWFGHNNFPKDCGTQNSVPSSMAPSFPAR